MLTYAHDDTLAGHPGADQTRRNVFRHFHWPGMGREVRQYVKRCPICNTRKSRRTDGDAQQLPREPTTPFDVIALDVMGPYPRSPKGRRFLLVVTDVFTKWVEAFPLSNVRAHAITQTLQKEYFPRWGYPRVVLTDNGSQFSGRQWRNTCDTWGVEHATTPTYHPGRTRRRGKTRT